MEVSPAKSLGVVSDSEGEEDGTRDILDMLELEPSAARFSGPRDWHPTYNGATIATNPSSHISQFSTPLIGQPPTMATDSSSIQTPGDLAWSATTNRPRPRPRMRPVPPPDDLESSSIGAFSTLPPAIAPTAATIASFDNSAVQSVPAVRPPSLPPSSLPQADSSSSMPAPTFPSPIREKAKSRALHETTPAAPSAVPATMDQPAPSAPKRPRPKMRPVPPPEPEVLPTTTNATTSSSATTTSSSNANPSTSATTASSTHDTTRRSALDDAEEYTGRGARRLAQEAKPTSTQVRDPDVDVGGLDDIINLIDSDDDYASKFASKPKPKPKPKPKKKDASKAGSTPAQSNVSNEPVSSSASGPSKRKPPQAQSSDDEFGRWDAVPGSSTSTSTKSKKRKKADTIYSDDEDAARPAPAHVPNTVYPPLDPPGPSVAHIPSSPLSSPGRSPAKRKGPPDSTTIPSPPKKSRKSTGNVLVGVVIDSLGNDENGGKKPKTKRKKTAKAVPTGDTVPSDLAPQEPPAGDEAYVPPALGSVTDPSSSGLHPESSKTKTTPSVSSGPSLSVQPVDPEQAQDSAAAPTDLEPAAPTKKQPKKRTTKAKKGAEDPAAADGEETPAPKKGAKGKSKAKAKESEAMDTTTDAAGASSSNPDTGAIATSSNPSADAGPVPTSTNSSASNQTPASVQTPAPKSTRPKPRHSTTPAPLPVAMGASGSLLRSGKSADRPLSETIRLAMGGSSTPSPRMGLSRRGSSKIAPLLAFRGVPPPPPPPMPKKPVRKKKGDSDDEDSEEGPEWEGLTEKQKEKKRREKEMAGWYSD